MQQAQSCISFLFLTEEINVIAGYVVTEALYFLIIILILFSAYSFFYLYFFTFLVFFKARLPPLIYLTRFSFAEKTPQRFRHQAIKGGESERSCT